MRSSTTRCMHRIRRRSRRRQVSMELRQSTSTLRQVLRHRATSSKEMPLPTWWASPRENVLNLNVRRCWQQTNTTGIPAKQKTTIFNLISAVRAKGQPTSARVAARVQSEPGSTVPCASAPGSASIASWPPEGSSPSGSSPMPAASASGADAQPVHMLASNKDDPPSGLEFASRWGSRLR